ncbi:M24 family metallopeptidase [Sphingomonas sp. MMS24-J13]|uniref:M24 family metallopeptidase n=1 Tax=Sphingomonas sp. MMS24-J13 TaxID=3238686 RepID=UPI0038501F0B
MTLFAADDPLRLSCYATRTGKVRDAMREAGHEVLIAYGNGRHSFIGMNPAWWLTGFKQMGPHIAVILPIDGEPSLIVTPCWDEERASERSVVGDIVACEPKAFMATVASELKRRGLSAAKIAVAGGLQMPRDIHEGWPETLGQKPADADQALSDLARERDEWSLKCTRHAVDIAEKGYDHLLANSRPGMYEHVVAGNLESYVRSLGAEDNFQLMSASQHNRSVHMPTNRLLADGDIILGEITPAVEGEYIQICRTAVFGVPTALQQEKFGMLDEALRAGMKAAKPGVPVSDVVAAINAPISKAGYEKYTVPPYMRTRGHSMSLGSMDPEIATFSGHVLVKGSVFVMHPNQYIPDTGYFMCGEPVIITDEGAKPLTSRMGELGSIL